MTPQAFVDPTSLRSDAVTKLRRIQSDASLSTTKRRSAEKRLLREWHPDKFHATGEKEIATTVFQAIQSVRAEEKARRKMFQKLVPDCAAVV